jgi:hypothetical protein
VIRILTTFFVLTLAAVSHAEDWPQWRGPSRDCQVKQQSWPRSLAEQNLQQAWSVPLGPSYSGPIVVGPRVFVTETRDKSHEVVRALDRQTGQEIWRVERTGGIAHEKLTVDRHMSVLPDRRTDSWINVEHSAERSSSRRQVIE